MTRATYQVRVDTGDSELYDTVGDDVTADARSEEGREGSRSLELAPRGRDTIRRGSPPRAGGFDTFLDNAAGIYGPASAMTSEHLVSVRAPDPTTGIVHDLFTGITQEPKQLPRHTGDLTTLGGFGTLSRITGGRSGVSTPLTENVTIDTALNAILDAAKWPKNLDAYAATLGTLAADWRMGEVGGDALDSTANGNDGSVTLGAGARAEPALDDAGDGSILFDGAATRVDIPDVVSIQNVFDGGGSLFFMFDANSGGPTSFGRIYNKNPNFLIVQDEAGGKLRIHFRQGFSDTPGDWITAVDIPIDATIIGLLTYNSDSVANNPTLYLWDGTSFSIRIVGDGLTVSSTPVGTRTTDAGNNIILGTNPGATNDFDGHLDGLKLWSDGERTAVEAKRLIARALNAPRHLDASLTTLRWSWLDEGADVWQHVLKLWRTEGPGADVFEDGTGAFVFKSRHARLLDARSTALQAMFNSAAGAAEPLLSDPFEHDDGKASIINTATLPRVTRSAKSLAVVWLLGETLILAPNESWTKTIRQAERAPFTAALDPVGATDYTVTAGSVSSATLDRTSGSSAKLTIVAGTGGMTITGLQVRAQTVSIDTETDVPDQLDAASPVEHGLPTSYIVIPELGLIDMQSLADGIVAFRKDARAKVSFDVLASRGAAAMTACLTLGPGDRIRVNEATSGVDINAHIGQVQHAVLAPSFHVTSFVAEQAAAVQGFIVDTSTLDGVDVLWF